MYDYVPLFIPSNLEETDLTLQISPRFENMPHLDSTLTYTYKGYSCFIRANTAKIAQQTVNRFSKRLENDPTHPIHSDRLYFLPLLSWVCYKIDVNPNVYHERPVIRISYNVEYYPQTWTCNVYVSNLVQLQEALFSHERNLLKKQLQILNRHRETWASAGNEEAAR